MSFTRTLTLTDRHNGTMLHLVQTGSELTVMITSDGQSAEFTLDAARSAEREEMSQISSLVSSATSAGRLAPSPRAQAAEVDEKQVLS